MKRFFRFLGMKEDGTGAGTLRFGSCFWRDGSGYRSALDNQQVTLEPGMVVCTEDVHTANCIELTVRARGILINDKPLGGSGPLFEEVGPTDGAVEV